MNSKSATTLVFSIFLLQLISCGRDNGYLYRNEPVKHTEDMGVTNPDVYPKETPPPPPITPDVSWVFRCPQNTTPRPIPSPGPHTISFEGPGPHTLAQHSFDGINVSIFAEVCEPDSIRRDMVIVLDTSGSMNDVIFGGGNDPYKHGSCGRLEAFNAILDTINWNTTRVGALTFSDGVNDSSATLFSTRAGLIDSLTSGGRTQLPDVICGGFGSTAYEPPLKAAQFMLEGGQQLSTKEIFFVTDGEPSDDADKVLAENRAKALKTQGVKVNNKNYLVTIATIMLGTDNDANVYLRDHFPSIDVNKNPIHAHVKDAQQLATTLLKMSENLLVGTSIQHGEPGKLGSMIDAMPYLSNGLVTLPSFRLSNTVTGKEYEVHFDYWDSHLNKTQMLGKLLVTP